MITPLDLSVIRDMPASIMVLDRDLRYVAASTMYLQTTGRAMSELAGRFVFEAFPEKDERRGPLEASMRRALAGDGNAIERLLYTIPDPSDLSRTIEAWWRCRHNPLYGPDGSIGHVVQITENITELVRAEEQRNAISQELQRRLGNLLSLVQVIARRTATTTETLPVFMEKFDARLQAMARTHAYLIETNSNQMSLGEVVARQLQPGKIEHAAQITLGGSDVVLKAGDALMLSIAIHELTTNALKYGALKDRNGRVEVSWGPSGARGFSFRWVESRVGRAARTDRTGFGSLILDTIVPAQLGGRSTRDFGPDGLRYVLLADERTRSA